MATTPKTKKPVSSTKSKVIASKKKGLSKKQWGIIATAGVIVLAVGGYFGFQAYQNSSSNAASCVSKTFKKGDTGKCVKDIQNLVNYVHEMDRKSNGSKYLGTFKNLTINGKYDAKTETAVKNIQAHAYARSQPVSTTGTVNGETWAVLCALTMPYHSDILIKLGCMDSKYKYTTFVNNYRDFGLNPTAH